jgi:hypothetical protein
MEPGPQGAEFLCSVREHGLTSEHAKSWVDFPLATPAFSNQLLKADASGFSQTDQALAPFSRGLRGERSLDENLTGNLDQFGRGSARQLGGSLGRRLFQCLVYPTHPVLSFIRSPLRTFFLGKRVFDTPLS